MQTKTPAEHLCPLCVVLDIQQSMYYDAGLQGHSDPEVYTYAQAHQQTIITIDLDFSNITNYPPPHFGIIVLRLPNSTSTSDLIQEVLNGLKTLAEHNLMNILIIVEPGRIRIRR